MPFNFTKILTYQLYSFSSCEELLGEVDWSQSDDFSNKCIVQTRSIISAEMHEVSSNRAFVFLKHLHSI